MTAKSFLTRKLVKVRWREVRAGDRVCDALNRPYFRVTSIHPARAKGYIVCMGENLMEGREGNTAGGFGANEIFVERD